MFATNALKEEERMVDFQTTNLQTNKNATANLHTDQKWHPMWHYPLFDCSTWWGMMQTCILIRKFQWRLYHQLLKAKLLWHLSFLDISQLEENNDKIKRKMNN